MGRSSNQRDSSGAHRYLLRCFRTPMVGTRTERTLTGTGLVELTGSYQWIQKFLHDQFFFFFFLIKLF